MMFMIVRTDKPGMSALRNETRPAHRAFVATIQSNLVEGGTFLDDKGEVLGSLLLLRATDEAEVERIMAEDPYAKAGLFESTRIDPYRQSIQNGARVN